MARTYCLHCKYPQKVCICSEVQQISSHLVIHIIQHQSEAKNAKNTARILQLCHPNTHIWVTKHGENLEKLKELCQIPNSTYLVYPDSGNTDSTLAAPSSPSSIQSNSTPNSAPQIILLDGTWKKAFMLFQTLTWLHPLTRISLENRQSIYEIRKVKNVKNSLSTLEAAVEVIHQFTPSCDTRPLIKSLQKMQYFYLQHSIKNYT